MNIMTKFLEIACFDPQSALLAAQAGADRIELCQNYTAGGLTPPAEWLKQLKNHLALPVKVMIRPRADDFVYSEVEFLAMRSELLQAKALGADGFVFGILNQAGRIDIESCKELLELAAPLPCTFHRAFDRLGSVSAALEGLEILIELGFSSILSSGLKASAMEGSEFLGVMVRQAAGRIEVIPGGGIRSGNIAALDAIVGAGFYHSAAWNLDAAAYETSGSFDAKEIIRLKLSFLEFSSLRNVY